jgi:hypothetical protein
MAAVPNLSALTLNPQRSGLSRQSVKDVVDLFALEVEDTATKRKLEDIHDPRNYKEPHTSERTSGLPDFAHEEFDEFRVLFEQHISGNRDEIIETWGKYSETLEFSLTNKTYIRTYGRSRRSQEPLGNRWYPNDNVEMKIGWEGRKATMIFTYQNKLLDIIEGDCDRNTFEFSSATHRVYSFEGNSKPILVEMGSFSKFVGTMSNRMVIESGYVNERSFGPHGLTGQGKRWNFSKNFGEVGNFSFGDLTTGKRVHGNATVEEGSFVPSAAFNHPVLGKGKRTHRGVQLSYTNQEGNFGAMSDFGALQNGTMQYNSTVLQVGIIGTPHMFATMFESVDSHTISARYQIGNDPKRRAYTSATANWSQHQLRAFGDVMDQNSIEFMAVYGYFRRPDIFLGRFARDRLEEEEYNGIEVVGLEKITYLDEFQTSYDNKVDTFANTSCPTVPKREQVDTDVLQSMLGLLRDDINQKYLFHGTTSKDVVTSIVANVGYSKEAARPGLFGSGWYFAQDPGKSDEYTGADQNGVRYMIIAKVALGCAAHVSKGSFEGGRTWSHTWRAALNNAFFNKERSFVEDDSKDEDVHQIKTLRQPFNSIIFDNLWQGRYKEFVVYKELQAIPAYIVAYKRVKR